jgi:hypothetical protein
MWHVRGRGKMHTGFWWGNPRERLLGRLKRRWEDNIELDLQEMEWGRRPD